MVAVTPFECEASTGGAGGVAGAVARVIGIMGGGLAGNQVEKNLKKVQACQVELRMAEGRRQTLEVDSPIVVGERVRVDGKALQPLAPY